MKFDTDFKRALSELPSKEKDRLILRLLKKDLNLANRLYFELVSELTHDDLRKQLENKIEKATDEMRDQFYSPGYLHMDLRFLSGEINDYVNITKDRYGEAHLQLKMMNLALKKTAGLLVGFPQKKSRKLAVYVIARAFKILLMIKKLHEDLWMEFEHELGELGEAIGSNPILMDTAMYHGLDVNWLIRFDLPEDLVEIHKRLRQNGYLK